MRKLRGNEALREALFQEMENDESVFVFGEDVGRYGGVYHVTQGLQEKFGAERVFDTPISESAIVGLAAGASILGMRPVAELQFTDLITIAMDQIVSSSAKVRYVTNGAMHAPMVIRTLNLGKGTVYSSQEFEAWFTHVPGLKVVMPSNPYDAKGLLVSAIRDQDPVIFFEHRNLYGLSGDVPEELYAIPFGQASVRRPGKDVTVVAYSHMANIAEQAAQTLAEQGIEVELIDPRTLVPFDLDAVVQSVCKTGRLVIAHEAPRRTGFGAEIAASIVDSEAFGYLNAPIVRVANPNVPVPHSMTLARRVLPAQDDIVAAVQRVMQYA